MRGSFRGHPVQNEDSVYAEGRASSAHGRGRVVYISNPSRVGISGEE